MPMSCQPTHLLGHYTHGLSMLCVSTIMLAIRAKPSDGPSHRKQVRGECQNIGGDVGLAASIGDLVLPEPRRCWSCLNRVESVIYTVCVRPECVMSNCELF